MKRPPYPYRIGILMAILTIPVPIGATQLGWYLYGSANVGFDYGMIVGTFSVILCCLV